MMKKSWFEKLWVWLMLIFIIHALEFIAKFNINVLWNNVSWAAVGAIGTVMSVCIAIIVFCRNNKRVKCQDSLKAFNDLKNRNFEVESIISEIDCYKLVNSYKNRNSKDISTLEKENWELIKSYLTEIERFSTGVNCNIYDVDTVNSMGGKYLYDKYKDLSPIIYYKRHKDNNDEIYKEFKNMVNSIVDIRSKKKTEALKKVD